jgi:hypothetical protein
MTPLWCRKSSGAPSFVTDPALLVTEAIELGALQQLMLPLRCRPFLIFRQ